MVLEIISEGLPDELKKHLMNEEEVYYFSYISSKGGCSSNSSRDEYWIALTNKRVLYKTKIIETVPGIFERISIIEKEGLLPIKEISFIEVTNTTNNSGCSKSKAYELRMSTSGGAVRIPVPSQEKGDEIRNIYGEIEERLDKLKGTKSEK